MDIIKNLRDSSKAEHWRDGLQWFGWSVLCGLFPLWATIALVSVTRRPLQLSDLADNGEFLLYAASYVGGALYLVLRDFRTKPFPSRSVLTLALTTVLVLATLFFAAVALIGFLGKSGIPGVLGFVDVESIRTISVILLPVACVLGYVINVADNVRFTPDLPEITKKQFKKLNDEFNQLGGGNHE